MPVSPARAAAFDILLRIERDGAYASELLHSPRCSELSSADQGLATELVMGALRWRSSLDRAIARFSSTKLETLDLEILIALRVGAYQIGWLDRIPVHAAVSESAELAKRARKRSAISFVNAVLRKLAAPGALQRPSLDLISTSRSAQEISDLTSHPLWLVERWLCSFGPEKTLSICIFDQTIPTTALRLRTAVAEHQLREEGVDLEAGSFLAGARHVLSGDVTKTKAYRGDDVVIQDEASQLVAALLGKGSRILDCCAAPGGKTWSIADRNPDAKIVAVELHTHRAQQLRKRVRAANVEVIAADMRTFPVSEKFDRVLVDVPCSGTGTIARNPEIKWRLTTEDLNDLHTRQVAILQSAMKQVGPTGRLLYSTCSLEPEENESVVGEALANSTFEQIDIRTELESLQRTGELTVADTDGLVHNQSLRTIPGVQACDGFFGALLQRVS